MFTAKLYLGNSMSLLVECHNDGKNMMFEVQEI